MGKERVRHRVADRVVGRFILQIRWGVKAEPSRLRPLGFGSVTAKHSQTTASLAVFPQPQQGLIDLYSDLSGTGSVRNTWATTP